MKALRLYHVGMKSIFLILGLTTLSCAFFGQLVENTTPSPSVNTPFVMTEVSQNSDFDSQARFVIKTVDDQYHTNFGYINQQGKIVIEPKFSGAGNFSEGLAPVQDPQTGLWGYIDPSGRYIIEPKYVGVGNFSEGLAFVQQPDSENLLCIDMRGQKVFELLFGSTISGIFPGGGIMAMIDPGYYQFHDGLALIDVKINEAYVEPNYVDRDGNLLFPNGSIVYASASAFSDGFAIATFAESNRELTIIDKDGKKVSSIQCPPGAFCDQGDAVRVPFSEGLTMMYANDGVAGRLYGSINIHGEFVIPPVYGFVGEFREGLAAVFDPETELYGFIDHSGTLVIPYQFFSEYKLIYGFSEGLAWVSKPDGQWGFIDKNGKFVFYFRPVVDGDFPYDSLRFHNGLVYVSDGINTGYINSQGNFVYIDPK